MPLGEKGFPYHAWLDCDKYVFDLTTYQLALKGRLLAAADGVQTTVQGCPDFLLIPRKDICSSHRAVVQAPTPGAVYYERRPELEPPTRAGYIPDLEDLHFARRILANPHVDVLGPQNAPAKMRRSNPLGVLAREPPR